MVVGEPERTDITLPRRAKWIKFNGKIQDRKLTVYSDSNDRTRRDIFPPDIPGRLPQNAQVRYLGKTYNANLTFLTGRGGSRIPVYTWRVSNPAKKR